MIISTLEPVDVLTLTGLPPTAVTDDATVLLAYVSFYDARGGGVETAIKDEPDSMKRFSAV